MDGIKATILVFKSGSYKIYDAKEDTRRKIAIYESARVELNLDCNLWNKKNFGYIRNRVIGVTKEKCSDFMLRKNHGKTYEEDVKEITNIGIAMYILFVEKDVEKAFNKFVDIGTQYAVIAYYLFLYDMNNYLPLRVNGINNALEAIGYDRVLEHTGKCSFANYMEYMNKMKEIKLKGEFKTLLEAHSLVWSVKKELDDRK